jgi:hypothetical protein
MVDLMAIVAGVGVAAPAWPPLAVPPPIIPFSLPIWFVIGVGLYWCILALAAGASLAVLARQARYRRKVRPAEWLGFLIALELVRLPNLDEAVNACFSHQWLVESFGICRWIIAGIALVGIFTGLLMLVLLGRWLPCWLKTVALTLLAILFLWGPAQASMLEFNSLLPAMSKFGPDWFFWIVVELRRSPGAIPAGLLYGIPATATLRSWRSPTSKPWLWTEKVGAGAGFLVGLTLLGFLYFGRSEWPPDGLRAERIVTPCWILAVWALSWWILRRFGPLWARYVAGECREVA